MFLTPGRISRQQQILLKKKQRYEIVDMKKTTFLYLFLILAFVSPVTVLSETKFPPLLSSMGYDEVLTSWGPPSEKEAHETKRVDVWHYSGA